jgi:hypothetical protein
MIMKLWQVADLQETTAYIFANSDIDTLVEMTMTMPASANE